MDLLCTCHLCRFLLEKKKNCVFSILMFHFDIYFENMSNGVGPKRIHGANHLPHLLSI